MNVHVFFSIFTADGQAYGKADIDTELAALPQPGQALNLGAISGAGKVDAPPIDVKVAAIEKRQGYVGLELTDVIASSRVEADLLCVGLGKLGFDCERWKV